MKLAITILTFTLAASAQVASHSPAVQPATAMGAPSGRPVVRVNGTALTDRDLVREMLNVFPYAKQHGGKFPKDSEPKSAKPRYTTWNSKNWRIRKRNAAAS